MSLRLLSARIVRSSAPLSKAASVSTFRGYATKKFSKDHEWVSVENGVGTVGITDHAQKTLGEIVFVELPEVGGTVEVGDSSGVVESVKAASEVISPVSGEVVVTNAVVADDPSLINEDAEGEAWIYRIKLANEKELGDLMDKDDYTKFCEEEH